MGWQEVVKRGNLILMGAQGEEVKMGPGHDHLWIVDFLAIQIENRLIMDVWEFHANSGLDLVDVMKMIDDSDEVFQGVDNLGVVNGYDYGNLHNLKFHQLSSSLLAELVKTDGGYTFERKFDLYNPLKLNQDVMMIIEMEWVCRGFLQDGVI